MNRFRYARLLGQSILLTNHKSGNIIMGITVCNELRNTAGGGGGGPTESINFC